MCLKNEEVDSRVSWRRKLKYDPMPALVNSTNEALRYLADRDLTGMEKGPPNSLWQLPAFQRIIAAQSENGSWRYHGGRKRIRSDEDYDQIETYRNLRELVEKYAINSNHPALRKAAEFLFGQQTDEGDFRGICGRQYVPYYSGAILELLIKSGYAEDYRIKKGFKWLLSNRQDDGGWAFPLRTVGRKLDPETFHSDTIEPDRSKPFSHLITGMVLRAFVAHPAYRGSREASRASDLLASRFFKADKYPDRRAPVFWTSFSFPF
jgi:hypothetical protein